MATLEECLEQISDGDLHPTEKKQIQSWASKNVKGGYAAKDAEQEAVMRYFRKLQKEERKVLKVVEQETGEKINPFLEPIQKKVEAAVEEPPPPPPPPTPTTPPPPPEPEPQAAIGVGSRIQSGTLKGEIIGEEGNKWIVKSDSGMEVRAPKDKAVLLEEEVEAQVKEKKPKPVLWTPPEGETPPEVGTVVEGATYDGIFKYTGYQWTIKDKTGAQIGDTFYTKTLDPTEIAAKKQATLAQYDKPVPVDDTVVTSKEVSWYAPEEPDTDIEAQLRPKTLKSRLKSVTPEEQPGVLKKVTESGEVMMHGKTWMSTDREVRKKSHPAATHQPNGMIVGAGMIVGPAVEGDTIRWSKPKKEDTLYGFKAPAPKYYRVVDGVEYEVTNTPILPKDRKKRIAMMKKLAKEKEAEGKWTANWRADMDQWVGKEGMTKLDAMKRVFIQSIMSAGNNPQQAQGAATYFINAMLDPNYTGPQGGTGTGISEVNWRKAKEVWEADELPTDLETLAGKYGKKVGAMIYGVIFPESTNPDSAMRDRHIDRLFGYNTKANADKPDGGMQWPVAVKKMMADDMAEVARDLGWSVPQVQAALWFQTPAPNEAHGKATFIEAMAISRDKFVDQVMQRAVAISPTSLIHWDKIKRFFVSGARMPGKIKKADKARLQELRNKIKNDESLSPFEQNQLARLTRLAEGDQPNAYSASDVGLRMLAHQTKEEGGIPYVDGSYWYLSGEVGESTVRTDNSIAHLMTVKAREVYDGTTDMLKMWDVAVKRVRNTAQFKRHGGQGLDTNSLTMNAFLDTVRKSGYKGVKYGKGGNEVVFFFNEVGPSELQLPRKHLVGMSDFVQKARQLPRNYTVAKRLARHFAENVSGRIQHIAKKYPVKVEKERGTVMTWDGEPEYGALAEFIGPSKAVKALLAEAIGLEKRQDAVLVIDPDAKPNGKLVQFQLRPGKEYEVDGKWLVSQKPSGNYVEHWVYEGDEKTYKELGAAYAMLGKEGTLNFVPGYGEFIGGGNTQEEVEGNWAYYLTDPVGGYYGPERGAKVYENALNAGHQYAATFQLQLDGLLNQLGWDTKQDKGTPGTVWPDPKAQLREDKEAGKGQGPRVTDEVVRDLQNLYKLLNGTLRKAGGAWGDVADRIELQLRPVIQVTEKQKQKILEDWGRDELHVGDILGLTAWKTQGALVQIALTEDLTQMEHTALHELWHVIRRLVLDPETVAKLDEIYDGDTELQANEWARFMQYGREAINDRTLATYNSFSRVKRFVEMVRNALAGKGFRTNLEYMFSGSPTTSTVNRTAKIYTPTTSQINAAEMDENLQRFIGPSHEKQMVYHGTCAPTYSIIAGDFEAFDMDKVELGIHCCTDPAVANAVLDELVPDPTCPPRVIPGYIRVENFVTLRDMGSWNLTNMMAAPRGSSIWDIPGISEEDVFKLESAIGDIPANEFDVMEDLYVRQSEILREWFLDHGIDGVRYLNRYEVPGEPYITYEDHRALTDEEFQAKYPTAAWSWMVFKDNHFKSPFNFNYDLDSNEMSAQLKTNQYKETPTHGISLGEGIDQLYDRNKFPERKSIVQNIVDRAKSALGYMSSEFAKLPNTARYAPIRATLNRLKKYTAVASDEAIRLITQDIGTDKMSTNELDLFGKAVWLYDLKETYLDDPDLPVTAKLPEVDKETGRRITKKEIREGVDLLEKALNNNPELGTAVREALERRAKVWDDLRNTYTNVMNQIGYNVDRKFRKKNYYRHLIHEYIRHKGPMGVGKSLRTPSHPGYLKHRDEEHVGDYTTNYMLAEHDVLSQMLMDVEVARAIKEVDANYNILDQVKKAAMEENETSVIKLFEQMVNAEEAEAGMTGEKLYRRLLNWKQAMAMQRLGKMATMGDLPLGSNGEWVGLVEALAENYEANKAKPKEDPTIPLDDRYSKQLFKYASYMLELGQAGAGESALLFKGIREKRDTIKNMLGPQYVTWQEIVNRMDGWEIFKPDPLSTFFLADSIPMQLMEDANRLQLSELGIPMDKIRKVVAIGGARRPMVLPSELAQTLNRMRPEADMGWIRRANRRMLKAWKVWQLVSPWRFLKYNIRNMTGDADAVFAGSPGVFLHVPEAIKDLWKYYYKHQEPTTNLRNYLDRGGGGSTLQAQEFGEMVESARISQFMRQSGVATATKIPVKAWKTYWKQARLATDFRESILRYAAYLKYLNDLETKGKVSDYGASRPSEVDALVSHEDKAFWLSNDLLGAYDKISEAGQAFRTELYPFWSWKEVNYKRYKQMFLNGFAGRGNSSLANMVGRSIIGKTAPAAFHVGMFAIRLSAFSAMLAYWNNYMYPYLTGYDDEESLPEDVAKHPHILLYRNSDGEVQYFSRLGAFNDLLEWFDLDSAPQWLHDVGLGRTNLKEIGKDMAKGFGNVMIGGMMPFAKLAGELVFGQALFPEVFNPRAIRDRTTHVLQSLGLGKEYRLLFSQPVFNVPTKPTSLTKYASGMFSYSVDPEEAAYRRIYDLKNEFLKSRGKLGEGFWLTPRGEALYNLKRAHMWGKKDLVEYWLYRYADLVKKGMGPVPRNSRARAEYVEDYVKKLGTNIALTFQRMSPLSGLTAKDKVDFLAQLTPRERLYLRDALQYYIKLRKGGYEDNE